ncbi:MAG: nucleoside recognition domain-containing protein [Lagierella massiliensis]|nr:nucleoside recognition domain-containing protein [Lagierella massiliensis]
MNGISNKRGILNREEIFKLNLDLEDLNELDSFSLSPKDRRQGLIKSFIFTAIAIFIFFIPITINGQTDITFGIIYNGLMNITGNYGLWFITIITLLTAILSIYGKYFAKSGKLFEYFHGDSIIHPLLYSIGATFAILYSLTVTTSFNGPEIIVGKSTGGTVIPSIAVAVFWIILVSSFCMPFLINYGFIDLIGTLMEPLMRPVFKLPGRASINALVSFLSSSSVGVLITNKLYRRGVYTEKEAVLVATGFSAVSVGFAYMVIKTAGLQDKFAFVYLISAFMTLAVSGIVGRIPPFSKKQNIYPNGKVQTKEDLDKTSSSDNIIKTAGDRAIKKAFLAPSLTGEIKSSLKDGLEVIPKVVTSLVAIGTGALILAENTPLFNVLGKLFVPILKLLQVPNALEIAASFPVGIAEMFLPVLLIAEKVAILDQKARFLVVSVSISQIIFFAETIVVMMSAKLPIKLWELVVVFIERTIIAIFIGALFMHIFF